MAGGGRGARFFHTAFAVALAVGLVSGTFILTDTIDAGFHRATTASQGSVDVLVRSTSAFSAEASALPERNPVPAEMLTTVRSVPGVHSAWAGIFGWAQVVDRNGNAIPPKGLPTLGAAWGPDQHVVAGQAPQGPEQVALDEATASSHGFRVGDRVKVLFGTGSADFVVSGLVKPGSAIASTLVTFDLATAQRVLERTDGFDVISVRAAAGVSPETLRADLHTVLPGQYEAVTAAQAAGETATSWSKALGFLTTALFVFAAIALLVGALIIFNTFSIVVGQRTRELGLLRAVGAGRGQLVWTVLREALAVGVGASIGGIVFGFGVAFGLLTLMRGVGYAYPVAGVVFLPRTAAVAMGVGVTVTVLAAVLPSRRATRVSPIANLGGTGPAEKVGVVGSARNSIVRFAVRLLAVPLVRIFGRPAMLGRENAARNPRRTSATAIALMIGIGLVGVVAIVAASMKASAERTVRQTLRADFVVSAKAGAGGGGGVPVGVAERLRAVPAVGTVSEIRTGQWGLDGTATSLVAVDPATVTRMHDLDRASRAAALRLDDASVLVRDTVASARGWRVGDTVPMTFARTGVQQMRLAATYSTTTVRADYVISLGAFDANFTRQLDTEVDVGLVAGTSPAAGRASVEQVLGGFPGIDVMNRDQVVAAQNAQVDRILVPVSALLALSLLIGLLGIANTLALSIHERTREIGMLRAIGMARGQLRSMIRSEAMIIAALGSVLGVGVAIGLGWLPVASMRSVGVTELVFPVTQLAGLVVATTVAGLAAGVLPARRAARLPVLDAVASDCP